MSAEETKARIETIRWVAHVALLSFSRYKEILGDETVFSVVFPGTNYENPKITHTVGKHIDFTTTKKELLASENTDLFKGWQIILGIVGMTSIFDLFLKSTADHVTDTDNSSLGIFKNFNKLTKIDLKKQPFFKELRKYHAVRDISIHNKGITNKKFVDKTNSKEVAGKPYVYYPDDLTKYQKILEEAIDYIEGHPQ